MKKKEEEIYQTVELSGTKAEVKNILLEIRCRDVADTCVDLLCSDKFCDEQAQRILDFMINNLPHGIFITLVKKMKR